MENLVISKTPVDFYRNKRVFITGHTGFKGAWLTAILSKAGAHVRGYALQPERPGGLFDYLDAPSENSVIADIRDRTRLVKEIIDFKPDFIFHLAAQPLVRRSYAMPAETFEVNVAGTANLLEAVTRLSGPCAVLVITTDKVYHNREEDVLYKEEDILGGYDPYSASKACCELVCDSFRKSFFAPATYSTHQKSLVTVRAGNVIGGGDWSLDRLMPDIIHSLQERKTILVRNPQAVRPWQHVLEAISGYLLLGEKLSQNAADFSGSYNFGPLPKDHLAVKDVVDHAVKYWGDGKWQDVSDSKQPHEAGLLKLDISKSLEKLMWKPKLDAIKAIEWTIDWYKQPEANKYEFTGHQIDEYFAL
jgi:CDP-glucose 4,6-dehydratase